MQLEDFEKQRPDEWRLKQSVPTIVGDLYVELDVHDRTGPPDEAMLRLASELIEVAQTHGELLLDSIYAHYRNAEEGGHLEFWDVPSDLTRETVLSEVESVTLSVSRDRDISDRPYDSCIQVVPNWEL